MNPIDVIADRLLSELAIKPILVDVGASSARPAIWNQIAQRSIYVGFDPDARDLVETSNGKFFKEFVINEAVTPDRCARQVRFYFTKSPYCSSMLKPDTEALSHFLFADLFAVQHEADVAATFLDAVLDRLDLPGIDWLKLDSQGVDLRLFSSLSVDRRSRLLGVDIEPGLIDAYEGEDLFVDAHRELTRNGYWLSALNVQGAVRMSRRSLNELSAVNRDIDSAVVERTIRKTPGWCEARYFKTLESMERDSCAKRDYALLWMFVLLDDQVGFALDVALEYARKFGLDATAVTMKDVPLAIVRERAEQKAGADSFLRSAARHVRRAFAS